MNERYKVAVKDKKSWICDIFDTNLVLKDKQLWDIKPLQKWSCNSEI